MFFIGRFIISWLIWFAFADKKRWRELLPVGLLAGFLGLTTDKIMETYELWNYYDANLNHVIIMLLDDWGLYIIVCYLFLQWLPEERTFLNMFKHFFIFTAIALFIEWIHLYTGHMKHFKFWNLRLSYICDWILYLVFYKFYCIMGLKKLSYETEEGHLEVESLGDILFILDKKGRIIDCHSQWLKNNRMMHPKDLIGKTIQEVKGAHDLNVHYRAYEKVLEGESVNFTWEWPTREFLYHFQTQLSPIKNESGVIVAMMGIDKEVKVNEVYPFLN